MMNPWFQPKKIEKGGCVNGRFSMLFSSGVDFAQLDASWLSFENIKVRMDHDGWILKSAQITDHLGLESGNQALIPLIFKLPGDPQQDQQGQARAGFGTWGSASFTRSPRRVASLQWAALGPSTLSMAAGRWGKWRRDLGRAGKNWREEQMHSLVQSNSK